MGKRNTFLFFNNENIKCVSSIEVVLNDIKMMLMFNLTRNALNVTLVKIIFAAYMKKVQGKASFKPVSLR